METCGINDEGVTLPPVFRQDRITSRDLLQAIESHQKHCTFVTLEIEERMRRIENRFALLIGFMFGSGLLGGMTGGMILKVLGG